MLIEVNSLQVIVIKEPDTLDAKPMNEQSPFVGSFLLYRQDKGQVKLYLRRLEKYERTDGGEKPVALILCAEKSQETIEFMDIDNASIHVAQYLTKMPPEELLEKSCCWRFLKQKNS